MASSDTDLVLGTICNPSSLLANSLVRGSAEDFKKAIADLKSVFVDDMDVLHAHGFSVNDYRICIILVVEITLVC